VSAKRRQKTKTEAARVKVIGLAKREKVGPTTKENPAQMAKKAGG
jgi:hypothetical protein